MSESVNRLEILVHTQSESSNTLSLTCSISNVGLVWRVQTYNYEMLFTAANSEGDIIIKGLFQAVLNTSNPTMQISTLLVPR